MERASSSSSSSSHASVAVAIDVPRARDVVHIARTHLATNVAAWRRRGDGDGDGDGEDEDEDGAAVIGAGATTMATTCDGFVADVLNIARTCALSERECGASAHARALEALRASDGWTRRAAAYAATRPCGDDDDDDDDDEGRDVWVRMGAPGMTASHEIAAHALAHRACRDERDERARRGDAVGARALERAMEVLEGVTRLAVKDLAKIEAAGASSTAALHSREADFVNDADADAMFRWVRERGGWCKFTTSASRAGDLRGVGATENARAGEACAYVPWNALIGVEQTLGTGDASPLVQCLNQLRALGDQVLMVIWLTATLGDAASPWAPALAALPKTPSTSLAWDPDAMKLVFPLERVTSLVTYQQSVRAQYDALFPALCQQVPDAFPLEIFGDYSRFLLAQDIWASYAMKVQDPETDALTEVIVPGVYLCNHSLTAHSVRYTRLEPGTKAFRLELARSVSTGEPVTISYGRLPNDDLLQFYGFSVQANPYDCLFLTPHVVRESGMEALGTVSSVCDYDLTELPIRFQRDAPLDRTLAQLRVLYVSEDEMSRRFQDPEYHPFVVTDVDSEVRMLREVAEAVRAKLEEERQRAASFESDAATNKAVSVIANATFAYRSGQMYIAQQTLSKLEVLIEEYTNRKRRLR